MGLTDLTITQAHKKLIKREISAQELTSAFLNRIEGRDRETFSFLSQSKNLALSQAKEINSWILEKKEIPLLAGIPMAVKDNILVARIKCTAASKILSDYIAPYDATVIKKLKAQGCIILGKTNLDEFAMGSSTENSAFGPTRNPYDLARVPGGSSGGSAAAVAANLCVFALGSDTGGSIRQPASFCGVVGLKPTYGAVSRFGLITMASSLDQIGSITKTVEDARIVFEAISGKDELDSTSVKTGYGKGLGSPYRQVSKGYVTDKCNRNGLRNQQTLNEFKIGIPREYFIKGMDKEVERTIKEAIEKIGKEGLKIEEISLPHTQYALACYYIIMPSEVSANLARYDGIKYGFSKAKDLKQKKDSLLDVYYQSRGVGFGKEARRRIMLGTYALSAGYYEAYYLRAQKVRTLIRKDFEKAFQKVDLILTPVSPTPAFKLGEKITDPLTMYLSDIFTIAINLAGLPAISIPCGKLAPHHFSGSSSDQTNFTKSGGELPVGLQIIGRPFEENRLFELGEFFEKIR